MAVGRDGTPSSLASSWQRWCCWGVLGTCMPGAVFREPVAHGIFRNIKSSKYKKLGNGCCQTCRFLQAPKFESTVSQFTFTCHFLYPSQIVSSLALQ